TSSWVGLGWGLSIGQISRSVVGVPDDMKDNDHTNVIMIHEEWQEDERSAWERFVQDYLLATILFIVAIIMQFIDWSSTTTQFLATLAFALISSIATQYYFTGGIDWNSVATDVVFSAATFGFGEVLKNIKMSAEIAQFVNLAQRAMSFKNCAAMASTVVSGSLSGGSTHAEEGEYTRLSQQNGFLYSPHYQESYSDDNYFYHDGGQPDMWNLGGPDVSGTMIIGGEVTPDYFVGLNYPPLVPKFYLSDTPSLENTDIKFVLAVDGSIEMFIVKGSSGKKYIYGHPDVEGSVEKTWVSASYREYDDDISSDWSYHTRDFNGIVEPHITNWKVTAILSPDYIDGGGDEFYPLDSEGSNKGSWVAFEYDLKHSYNNGNDANCGFGYSNKLDGTPDYMDSGNMQSWSGSIVDISYLKKIITPTHEAEFFISERADGREGQPDWYYPKDNYYGPMSFNIPPPGDCPYTCDGSSSNNCCTGSYDCASGEYDGENADTWTCTPNSFVCATPNCGCSGTKTSTDYPYKLDRIDLKTRSSSVVIGKVIFNKGVSDEDTYLLREGSPGNDNYFNINGGVYTLNNVAVCDASGSECKTTYFKY
ncbi:hypothetical protein CMO90_02555, partial [Candidatus Woesearchaeota archaeon]|nr:hypothetical protein [Candidatus Woesearchaeota archaeon]